MAKLKKYNSDTQRYEETGIIALSCADGSTMTGAKVTVPLEDIAASTTSDGTYTTYIVENVNINDVITTVNLNGGTIFRDADGTNITSLGTSKFYDNYSWCLWTFVAEQEYASITVTAKDSMLEKHTPSITYTLEKYKALPSFNREIIPTISELEESDIKTFSSEKITQRYGKSEIKTFEKLKGKVWIALGDSYTAYAKTQFATLAEKYGVIIDNRGIASSTIAGDEAGNKGWQPMWKRASTMVEDYTNGYVINDVTYTLDDVALITFMGGANDGFGKTTYIGTSPSETSCEKIYGALNHIYNVLSANFSNAKIITILQPAHFNYKVSNFTTDEEATILGFENLASMQVLDDYQFSNYAMANKEYAVKEMALRYHSVICDCFSEFPSVLNPIDRTTYWQSDKLHLTTEGTQLLTDKLEKTMLETFG